MARRWRVGIQSKKRIARRARRQLLQLRVQISNDDAAALQLMRRLLQMNGALPDSEDALADSDAASSDRAESDDNLAIDDNNSMNLSTPPPQLNITLPSVNTPEWSSPSFVSHVDPSDTNVSPVSTASKPDVSSSFLLPPCPRSNAEIAFNAQTVSTFSSIALPVAEIRTSLTNPSCENQNCCATAFSGSSGEKIGNVNFQELPSGGQRLENTSFPPTASALESKAGPVSSSIPCQNPNRCVTPISIRLRKNEGNVSFQTSPSVRQSLVVSSPITPLLTEQSAENFDFRRSTGEYMNIGTSQTSTSQVNNRRNATTIQNNLSYSSMFSTDSCNSGQDLFNNLILKENNSTCSSSTKHSTTVSTSSKISLDASYTQMPMPPRSQTAFLPSSRMTRNCQGVLPSLQIQQEIPTIMKTSSGNMTMLKQDFGSHVCSTQSSMDRFVPCKPMERPNGPGCSNSSSFSHCSQSIPTSRPFSVMPSLSSFQESPLTNERHVMNSGSIYSHAAPQVKEDYQSLLKEKLVKLEQCSGKSLDSVKQDFKSIQKTLPATSENSLSVQSSVNEGHRYFQKHGNGPLNAYYRGVRADSQDIRSLPSDSKTPFTGNSENENSTTTLSKNVAHHVFTPSGQSYTLHHTPNRDTLSSPSTQLDISMSFPRKQNYHPVSQPYAPAVGTSSIQQQIQGFGNDTSLYLKANQGKVVTNEIANNSLTNTQSFNVSQTSVPTLTSSYSSTPSIEGRFPTGTIWSTPTQAGAFLTSRMSSVDPQFIPRFVGAPTSSKTGESSQPRVAPNVSKFTTVPPTSKISVPVYTTASSPLVSNTPSPFLSSPNILAPQNCHPSRYFSQNQTDFSNFVRPPNSYTATVHHHNVPSSQFSAVVPNSPVSSNPYLNMNLQKTYLTQRNPTTVANNFSEYNAMSENLPLPPPPSTAPPMVQPFPFSSHYPQKRYAYPSGLDVGPEPSAKIAREGSVTRGSSPRSRGRSTTTRRRGRGGTLGVTSGSKRGRRGSGASRRGGWSPPVVSALSIGDTIPDRPPPSYEDTVSGDSSRFKGLESFLSGKQLSSNTVMEVPKSSSQDVCSIRNLGVTSNAIVTSAESLVGSSNLYLPVVTSQIATVSSTISTVTPVNKLSSPSSSANVYSKYYYPEGVGNLHATKPFLSASVKPGISSSIGSSIYGCDSSLQNKDTRMQLDTLPPRTETNSRSTATPAVLHSSSMTDTVIKPVVSSAIGSSYETIPSFSVSKISEFSLPSSVTPVEFSPCYPKAATPSPINDIGTNFKQWMSSQTSEIDSEIGQSIQSGSSVSLPGELTTSLSNPSQNQTIDFAPSLTNSAPMANLSVSISHPQCKETIDTPSAAENVVYHSGQNTRARSVPELDVLSSVGNLPTVSSNSITKLPSIQEVDLTSPRNSHGSSPFQEVTRAQSVEASQALSQTISSMMPSMTPNSFPVSSQGESTSTSCNPCIYEPGDLLHSNTALGASTYSSSDSAPYLFSLLASPNSSRSQSIMNPYSSPLTMQSDNISVDFDDSDEALGLIIDDILDMTKD